MAEDWSRPVVHWELVAKDPDNIAKFYGELCNWTFSEGPVMNISPGIGAPEPITGHVRQGDHPGVVLFIQVLDLAASLDKVRTLGGTVLRGPFQPPGAPTLAWVADPEGNRVTLVQQ